MAAAMAWLKMGAAFVVLQTTGAGQILLKATGLRRNGVLVSSHFVTQGVRMVNRLWGVQIECTDLETLRNHEGLILSNHTSFLDITTFLGLRPTRFLAAQEVRSEPVVGRITESIGSVFIDRGNIRSAVAARKEIADAITADPSPPFVIYPEGWIGELEELQPFRRGTFRIAIENELPYLLCAIRYSEPELTTWRDPVSMTTAIARLFHHPRPIIATVSVLATVTPKPDDKPQALSAEAYRVISQGLYGQDSPPALAAGSASRISNTGR